GKGRRWFEPLTNVVNWHAGGMEIAAFTETSKGVAIRNTRLYFVRGVAFTKIGASFGARIHRYHSIFGDAGQSIFPERQVAALALMNATQSEMILRSLNPTVNFTPGDVNRLPLVEIS